MQHYTVQDILALRPCQPTKDRPDAGYPEDKLRMLFGDRESVTLLEICDDARVPIEDRQWVLHRLLPEPLVHEAVCRYAERALARERTEGCEPDPRSWAAIAAKRQWLRGEISDVDLDVAEADARTAARDAVRTAARATWAALWASSRNAGRTATEAAVWASSWAATWAGTRAAAEAAIETAVWASYQDVERQWQLDTIREMIEEMED